MRIRRVYMSHLKQCLAYRKHYINVHYYYYYYYYYYLKTSGTPTGELETLVSPKFPFTKILEKGFLSIPVFYIL